MGEVGEGEGRVQAEKEKEKRKSYFRYLVPKSSKK